MMQACCKERVVLKSVRMRKMGTIGLGALAVFVSTAAGCGWILGLDEYSLDTCRDRVLGPGEEAVDCGGPCTPCKDKCVDNVRSGSETDVDCGGPCGPCEDGRGCIVGPDCESLVCSAGICLPPACDDKVQNGSETDRDCGGTCSIACVVGNGCAEGDDCESLVCGEDLQCASNHTWSKAFNSTMFTSVTIATDASGNVLLAGAFTGSINFGGDELVAEGDYDVFVAKFTHEGTHLWSRRFGDASMQIATKLSADPAGNIYIVGEFNGELDFGMGVLTSAGETDIFVAKFDSNGGLAWGKRFGDGAVQRPESVVVTPGGGVVVSGSFEGTLDFGGAPLISAGNKDAFVACLDLSGNHIWSKEFGDDNFDQIASNAAIGDDNSLLVTGAFSGTIDLANDLVTNAAIDAFILRLDITSGDVLWGNQFGSSAGQEGGSFVGLFPTGEILLVGVFDKTLNIIGDPISPVGYADIFALKLTASGNPIWVKGFGSNLNDLPFDVDLSADSKIVIGGMFGESINFGGGPLAAAGKDDLFLAELDSNGNHLWSRRSGGETDSGSLWGLALGTPGVVFTTGFFEGTIDLGGAPLKSTGDGAIFLAKYLLP